MNNGRHLILDLYDCDVEILDDYSYLQEIIQTAVRMSGATLLSITGQKFEPHGVTILALLAESHASIHTWIETKYAAVDLYTCNGDKVNAQKAADFIKHKLKCQYIEQTIIERKLTQEPRAK